MTKVKKVDFTKTKTLSVRQATDAHQAISSILEADKTNKLVLTGAARTRLALNLRKTKPIVEEFMNQNNALVEKFGEKEIVVQKVDGVDTPKETGRFTIKAASPKFNDFAEAYKQMVEEDSGVVLNPLQPYELYGVSVTEYNDPKADPKKQNQISTEVVGVLIETGLLAAE